MMTSGLNVGAVIAVVLVAAFIDLLDVSIVSVAAPSIAEDLGASAAELQWLVATYTAGLGCALIVSGMMGDLYGRRRVFLAGLAAFTVTSALCALAASPEMLIAFRVAQGLAAGVMVPQVLGIIRGSLDGSARSKALGAYGAVLGLASVAGPLLGGLLVDANLFDPSWRGIFLINIPIGIITLIIGAKVLPYDRRDENSASPDWWGAALLMVITAATLIPLVQGREWGWPWEAFALLGLAFLGAVGLIQFERRRTRAGLPVVLDPELFRVRSFSAALLIVILFFGSLGPFFLFLVLYLQAGLGFSALMAGLVMVPYAVGSILTSGVGVQFAARLGRTLLIAGAVLLAASQMYLWAVVNGSSDPGYWALALPLFVGGLGLGLAAPSLIDVALGGVPKESASTAAGVLTTASQLGSALGVALLGVVFFGVIDSLAPEQIASGFSDALLSTLPYTAIGYVVCAGLMFFLPAGAASAVAATSRQKVSE